MNWTKWEEGEETKEGCSSWKEATLTISPVYGMENGKEIQTNNGVICLMDTIPAQLS